MRLIKLSMRSQFHILAHVGNEKAKVDAEFEIPIRLHGIAHNRIFRCACASASMGELIKSRHENKTLIIMGALMAAWALLYLCLRMRIETLQRTFRHYLVCQKSKAINEPAKNSKTNTHWTVHNMRWHGWIFWRAENTEHAIDNVC